MKLFQGNLPDITPAQIAAVLTFVIGQAVAWGWVDNQHAKVLISSGSIIIAAVWKLADAYLRGQRAQATAVNPKLPTTPGSTS
jgi:hypothetical protein